MRFVVDANIFLIRIHAVFSLFLYHEHNVIKSDAISLVRIKCENNILFSLCAKTNNNN